MGTWGHGYFDNDGAADLLAELENARHDRGAFARILNGSIARFENFLTRDAQGLTFRPMTAQELAEDDLAVAVRHALADLPELLQIWETGPDCDPAKLLCDTGDHEAQQAVAAAAVLLAASGSQIAGVPRAEACRATSQSAIQR